MKRNIELTLLFLIMIMILTGCKDKSAAPPSMMGMPVEASSPEIKTVYKTLKATGTLYPQQEITVTSEIAGRIIHLPFKEGELLQKDAVLIAVDDTLLQAELKKAKAAMNLSQLTYERAKSLLIKGSGAQSEVDRRLSELKINEANVDWSEAQLQKTQIRAPFTGFVGMTSIDIGEYIKPGQEIAKLSDISTLKLNFRLPEIFYQKVKLGQMVEIEVGSNLNKKFTGKVVAIDPQMDIAGRSVLLQAKIANPTLDLRPGLFAMVDLVIETHERALLVPEQAIQYDTLTDLNNTFVYLVKTNKNNHQEAVKQQVITGIHENGQVEITKGITKDDRVITSGHIRLFPHAPIKVAK